MKKKSKSERTMIFKMQRSIFGTESKDQVLIYNKDCTMCFQVNFTKECKRIMGKDLKIFAHGKMEKATLRIIKRANWQKW